MSSRERVAGVWDRVVGDFLVGSRSLPPPLDRWRDSYQGKGAGKVELKAFPEPYLGSLHSEPSAVFLALNPGRADLGFQSASGTFAREIRQFGSYRAWAASWPYLREPWCRKKGKNRHHAGRLTFMRRWYGDESLGPEDMLAFELYPWHSTRVTGRLRPDPEIVREFVWDPIAELGNPPVFAFGAPWFPILEHHLGLEVLERLGRDGVAYSSRVPSRSVLVLRSATDGLVIAEKHAGAAGPPTAEEVVLLRETLAIVGGFSRSSSSASVRSSSA